MENKIKAFLAAVFGVINSLFGVLTVPILLMVGANVIDYVTGLIAAPHRQEDINSYQSMRGIWKKICMWILVLVGALIDQLILYTTETIGLSWSLPFLVAGVVAIWIICNEIISILENLQDIGIAMPPFLLPLLTHIKSYTEDTMGDADKEDDDES